MLRVVRQGRAGFQASWRVRLTRALFVRILQVGAVASGLALMSNVTTVVVTSMLRHLGPTAVAAYGIAARLEFLIILLAWGVGSALTALVGRTAWLGGALAFGATAPIGLAVGALQRQFAGLFTADAAVVDMAARALRYTGPAFGGFGLGMAMYFASMGAQRTGTPVVAGLARLLIATGGGWCLANGIDIGIGSWPGMGTDGHFLGVALGLTAYGLITASGVRPGVWRQPGPRR